MIKTIFTLGRQPELGRAELERCVNNLNIEKFNETVAVSDQEIEAGFINTLGGTIKIAKFLGETNAFEWSAVEGFIVKYALEDILKIPEGKINLGISCYGLQADTKSLNRLSLSIKKIIKSHGRSIRVVPNQSNELSSAQVLYNKLVGPNGFEIVLAANGNHVVIGKTIATQNIDAYAARDQARPKRDAKVGMLPPKLAQIMINIASPLKGSTVLDPFCGTGVILQESLLMGFPGYGSDIDERMVEFTKQNLDWLDKNFDNLPSWEVEQSDATNHKWDVPLYTVVSETYLGKPLFNLPNDKELDDMISDINKLVERFLVNLASQIPATTSICIAVPAWRTQQGFKTLPVLDHLEEIGYNHLSFKTVDTRELIYNRPQQLVARQLLALIRK